MESSSLVLFTGPLFLGSVFSWCLFGTFILQVYIFSISFPNERLGIRLLVYGLLVLDIVQTIFSTHWVWRILVLGWGDTSVLSQLPWSSITIPILSGIVSAIVQFFFAWRIWSLKGRSYIARVMVIVVVSISLMQSISAIYGGIRSAINATVAEFAALTSVVEVWLVGSAVCDILIAGSMSYILIQARLLSSFRATETMITKLIIIAVETGTVTAVAATIDVVLFLKMKDNFVHEVPALLLGKLYTNVLMANLNGRIRNKPDNVTHSGSVDSSYISRIPLRRNGQSSVTTHMADKITVVKVSTSETSEGTSEATRKV